MMTQDEKVVDDLMHRAFDYDYQLYHGPDSHGGPPGYDDGQLLERIKDNSQLENFVITEAGTLIGFLSVELAERHLWYFCIDPQKINKGYGTKAWQLFEEMFGAEDWQVETPEYSLRNHHFYEKLGFKKVGEVTYSTGAIGFAFKK